MDIDEKIRREVQRQLQNSRESEKEFIAKEVKNVLPEILKKQIPLIFGRTMQQIREYLIKNII